MLTGSRTSTSGGVRACRMEQVRSQMRPIFAVSEIGDEHVRAIATVTI